MAVRIGIAALLLTLLACAAGSWALVQPGTAPFVVAGARGVEVAELRPGERRITYQLEGDGAAWQTEVVQRLRRAGWSLAGDRYAWGDTERYIPTYERTARVGPLELHEQARLIGDRRSADILLERRLQLRW